MRTALSRSLFSLAIISFVSAALAQALPQVAGTVTKVDASADKITIRHGPIPNLDMGEMTMVFKAGSPDMVKQLKAGDQISFTADRVNGQITVTSVSKAK